MSAECRVLNGGEGGPLCACAPGVCDLDIRTPPPEGYPVRMTKYEARLLMKLLTMQLDYPDLEPEHKTLFDKLEAVL